MHYCACFTDGNIGTMLQTLHYDLFFLLLDAQATNPRLPCSESGQWNGQKVTYTH